MTFPNIEETLAEVRRRVAFRRQAGDYPPGLELQLESEFRVIMDNEVRDWHNSISRLDNQMQNVVSALDRFDGTAGISSRIPGGSMIHRLIRRVLRRQVGAISSQLRDISHETVVLLRMIVELQKAQEDADRRLVVHLTKSTLDRLAVVDHLALLINDLERRFNLQFPS